MDMELTQHPSDDTLEAYVMRTLPEMEVAPFEGHLIICQLCRERFRETDEFVTAMGAAATEHRRIQRQ